MEENFKNKLGFFTFFFIVLFLLVGGYIYTNHSINEKKNNLSKNKEDKIDYRIDNKKDYIYYINESVLSSDAEIDYKDVVINLEVAKTINESLSKENKSYRENIQYITDHKDEILRCLPFIQIVTTCRHASLYIVVLCPTEIKL